MSFTVQFGKETEPEHVHESDVYSTTERLPEEAESGYEDSISLRYHPPVAP